MFFTANLQPDVRQHVMHLSKKENSKAPYKPPSNCLMAVYIGLTSFLGQGSLQAIRVRLLLCVRRGALCDTTQYDYVDYCTNQMLMW